MRYNGAETRPVFGPVKYPPGAKGAMPLPMDDVQLLRRIAARDAQALSLLYDRYARLVFSLALHILGRVDLAEEVTQEVFWRVWEKAATYRPERGSVRTWLTQIARNRALDVRRREQRRPLSAQQLSAPPDPIPAPSTISPEEYALQAWEYEQLRQAVEALPEEQRHVLLLAYFEGLSHQQIAQRLRLPLGTVKSRLRAALQRLRQALGESRDHPSASTKRILQ